MARVLDRPTQHQTRPPTPLISADGRNPSRTRAPSAPAGGSLSRLLSGLSPKLMSSPSTDTDDTSLALTRLTNSLKGTCYGGWGERYRACVAVGLGVHGAAAATHPDLQTAERPDRIPASCRFRAQQTHAVARAPHLQRDGLWPRPQAPAAHGPQPDEQEQRHHVQQDAPRLRDLDVGEGALQPRLRLAAGAALAAAAVAAAATARTAGGGGCAGGGALGVGVLVGAACGGGGGAGSGRGGFVGVAAAAVAVAARRRSTPHTGAKLPNPDAGRGWQERALPAGGGVGV